MAHYFYNAEQMQLTHLLKQLQKGDTLEVESILDLDMSLKDLTKLCSRAEKEGWVLMSTSEDIDTSDVLICAHLSWLRKLLELEQKRQRQKSKAAVRKAKQEGKDIGRPSKMSAAAKQEAVRMVKKEGWTVSDVARAFQVHPSTISRLVKHAS